MTAAVEEIEDLGNQYPTGRYAESTQRMQRELIALGFLAPRKANGDPSDDGWMGPRTEAALAAYHESLRAQPLPPKPWWTSKRGQGLATMGLGTVLGVAGFWWDGARAIDSASVVDIIYQAGQHIEQAWASGTKLWELGSALITAIGFGTHVLGAVKADRPLELRRHRDGDAGGLPRASGALSTDGHDGAARGRGYWGARRGPFLDND